MQQMSVAEYEDKMYSRGAPITYGRQEAKDGVQKWKYSRACPL